VGTASQRERRNGGALELGCAGWGSWAGSGPRGKRKGEGVLGLGGLGQGREGERGVLGWWAGLFSFSPFLFLFLLLFYTQLIQTNLLEFKIPFEFKPINSTQIKQCCSMNAQAS
jgi:hypothetical protein